MKNRAFTLIEIMIVVSIVIILALLAVPNILRSRISANEGAVIANLKLVSSACQLYQINSGAYPNGLADLANSNPPYIDSQLGGGNKQGYLFNYSQTSDGFSIQANPNGLLKGRYFYVDQTDVVRGKAGGPASSTDNPVQ